MRSKGTWVRLNAADAPSDGAGTGLVLGASVYAPRSSAEGGRVLVDRLWPRGLARDSGQFEVWMKAIAPSTELRRWYHHQANLLPEFRRRYREELQHAPGWNALERLASTLQEGEVTLVTATHELSLSAARVLADELALRADVQAKLQSQSGAKPALAIQKENL